MHPFNVLMKCRDKILSHECIYIHVYINDLQTFTPQGNNFIEGMEVLLSKVSNMRIMLNIIYPYINISLYRKQKNN